MYYKYKFLDCQSNWFKYFWQFRVPRRSREFGCALYGRCISFCIREHKTPIAWWMPLQHVRYMLQHNLYIKLVLWFLGGQSCQPIRTFEYHRRITSLRFRFHEVRRSELWAHNCDLGITKKNCRLLKNEGNLISLQERAYRETKHP